MLWGADWWEALTAIGTVSAVVVAIAISLGDAISNRKALKQERQKADERTATLVSAWVETNYIPSQSGSRYDKISVLKISNESDEPVYDVSVNIALQGPFRQIGPLAVPSPIPTLAPRTVRQWDISAGLLAHDHDESLQTFVEPVARIIFTDPRKQRWQRNYTGVLEKSPKEEQEINTDLTPENELQIGPFSRLNPLVIAMAFLAALKEEKDPNVSSFPGTLDPQADGWKKLTREAWAELRQQAFYYAIPTHVWYRTPRVAYVRLINESQLDEPFTPEKSGEFTVDIITLVFRGSLGWRVFSFGPTPPEWIEFSPGATHGPFRSYLDSEDEN